VKLLLDTHVFLWIVTDAPQLSQRAREAFEEPDNDVYLSAVSAWEIMIKYSIGKLPLPRMPEQYIPQQRKKHAIAPLALGEEETFYLKRLPSPHKDPFDRMLICQAIVHELTLLTVDPLMTQYPVRTLW
jgi:PIN domain nuclease of toxin-antitoxin system